MIGTFNSWFATWTKKFKSRLRSSSRGCDEIEFAPSTGVESDSPTLSSPLVPEAELKPSRDKQRNKAGTVHFGNLILNASLIHVDIGRRL